MSKCDRCGTYVHEDDAVSAEDYGWSSLCEDCADQVIEYDVEEEEEDDPVEEESVELSDHAACLEALRNIRVDQIQTFIVVLRNIAERGVSEVSAEYKQALCPPIDLNPEYWSYYEELAIYMDSGTIPHSPVIQVACSAFFGAPVRRTIENFSVLDKATAVAAYEIGNEWSLDNHRMIYTTRAIDSLVSLYATQKLELDEGEENRCIAFPGMPELPHYFQEMYKLIEEARLVIDGMWRCPLQHFRAQESDFIWNYPPDVSDKNEAIIKTDAGTIYLIRAPKRGDTNANHLRSV